MPSRPYKDVSEAVRAEWSAEDHRLHDELRAGLNAEASAKLQLGTELATARTSAHMSQPELAAKSGVQQADISRIERGLGNPTRDTLLRIADALGLRLTVLPKE